MGAAAACAWPPPGAASAPVPRTRSWGRTLSPARVGWDPRGDPLSPREAALGHLLKILPVLSPRQPTRRTSPRRSASPASSPARTTAASRSAGSATGTTTAWTTATKPPSSAVRDPSCAVGLGLRLPQMWGQWLGQGQAARSPLSPLQLEERSGYRRTMLIEIPMPSLRLQPFSVPVFLFFGCRGGMGWDEGRVLSVFFPHRPAHLPFGPLQVQEQPLHPQPLALRRRQRLREQRGRVQLHLLR